MAKRPALKLPGKIYEQLISKAQDRLDAETDMDLCDALSHPIIKPRGLGHTVLVPMEPGQVKRLAGWISDDDPKRLREYRAAMVREAEAQGAA